jgi:hypothetical protein
MALKGFNPYFNNLIMGNMEMLVRGRPLHLPIPPSGAIQELRTARRSFFPASTGNPYIACVSMP